MEKERIFVCTKTEGYETLVGVDVDRQNAEGRFETIAKLRAKIDDRTHKAVIQKGKSTTKGQNFEGYYKCEKQFAIIAKEFGVQEIIDEREQVLNCAQDVKNEKDNASAF